MAQHDIRMHIPLVARNVGDPEAFYEHQEYPKMMLMLCDQKYLDEWLARNMTEDERGRKSYKGGRPRVGTLVPILDDSFNGFVVHDADEEEAFRLEHPEAATLRSGPPPDQGEFTALEQKNRALEEQLSELRAKLAGNSGTATPPDNGVKGMVSDKLKLPKDLK